MSWKNHARVLMLSGLLIGLAGCGNFKLQVNRSRIQKGEPTTVSASLLKDVKPDLNFNFEVSEGTECGGFQPATTPPTAKASAKTNDQGLARVTFLADPNVASPCQATITVTDPNGNKEQAVIKVLPDAGAIEASTAIIIILIASFAIDRIVSALMFLFRTKKKTASLPDEPEKRKVSETQKRREKLLYLVLAGTLGLALGYWGEIRILEGLGFSKNVLINVILTALILTAGSESISLLLKKMGAGSVVESDPKPLEVRGNLILERPADARKEAVRRTAEDQD